MDGCSSALPGAWIVGRGDDDEAYCGYHIVVQGCRFVEKITPKHYIFAMNSKSLMAVGALFVFGNAVAAAADGQVLDAALQSEQRGEWAQAEKLYRQALAANPQFRRDALLGLARVARGEARLDDARAIYHQLLVVDPGDADGIKGLAWADLADHNVEAARAGFQGALHVWPGDNEALEGLSHADRTWRYQLDVSGSYLHSDLGSRRGGSIVLAGVVDARQSIEVALRRNSADEGLFDRPLSGFAKESTAARFSYYWQIPQSRGVALAYEQVSRPGLSDQQRLSASADVHVSDKVRITGGVRQSFGSGWRYQLFHLGGGVALGGGWEAVATGYAERNTDLGTRRTVMALEAVRQGPGRMLFVLGASHGDSPRTTEIYGRTVFPVTAQGALLLTARRLSLNHESHLELGWRHHWN